MRIGNMGMTGMKTGVSVRDAFEKRSRPEEH
jgi:hypothetical protein